MRPRHFLLLLAVAAFARATTVEPPTFTELVAEAESIYRGEVKTVQSRRVTTPTGDSVIKTFVTFAVERTLKGTAQSEVVLEFLGGTVGDDRLEVGGMPKFNVGQREIVFVQKNGTQFCPLVRVMHGRYRVEREAATGREYVARDNRVPLTDVSEVNLPLGENALTAAARADTSHAMSASSFEATITQELRNRLPSAKTQ
jgi:hypothetical protein